MACQILKAFDVEQKIKYDRSGNFLGLSGNSAFRPGCIGPAMVKGVGGRQRVARPQPTPRMKSKVHVGVGCRGVNY